MLYGGCLSLLTASLGTRFAAQTEGKLLFLEDLAEKPYQIDRMLRQMKLAGKLEGVTGIIFGEMLDCASPGSPADLTERVILTVLEWFSGPIAYGLRSGHVSRGNVTLPFGVEAELVVDMEGHRAAGGPAGRGSAREAMKIETKHVHLIGICGTAMASLAGMLQLEGHTVTGSDAAAYPPMSDLAGGAGNNGDGAVLQRRTWSHGPTL